MHGCRPTRIAGREHGPPGRRTLQRHRVTRPCTGGECEAPQKARRLSIVYARTFIPECRCWRRSKRSTNRWHVSSHAKIRSTRIRNAWMAASKRRLRARGCLVLARTICAGGDEARMAHAMPMACGITAAIGVEGGASQVRPDLLGYLLHGFEPLRP